MKKLLIICTVALCTIFLISEIGLAGSKARKPAIVVGADRVCYLQRTDAGWEGTWYWYVGSAGDATNLTGVTALGLLEAFNDTKDAYYLDAAKEAAAFIMVHLGADATEKPAYWPRLTFPDVIFLHKLAAVVTDDDAANEYSTRATSEWNNLKASWPTAGNLDDLFKTISRPSAWDIAFALEAAYLSGDTEWAEDAAGIISDPDDAFYYGDTWWYALNLAGAVRAVVGCGYFEQFSQGIITLYGNLRGLVDSENGIDGWVQDTAYAVMALNTVGGNARQDANALSKWLATQQQDNGGWLDDGVEYPEADGEALRALSCSIGSNITIDGFEPGSFISSSWRRPESSKKAEPFMGE